MTSATRSIKLPETPAAILPIVPILAGTIAMPSNRNEPLAMDVLIFEVLCKTTCSPEK